ncbi:MAG: hypothetical protein AB1921_03770 [Thermodesulfobacteriota bacterium]
MNPGELFQNAVLFKDLTQWFRSRGFLGLFFGLLAFSYGLYALAFFLWTGVAGAKIVVILSILLLLYGLSLMVSSYSSTMADRQNGSFELYELTGILPPGLVWGKLSSLVIRFVFGYFCIAPFIMLGYFFGGVDFSEIAQWFAFLLLAAVFIFLASLAVSFTLSRRNWGLLSLGALAGLFAMIFQINSFSPAYHRPAVYYVIYYLSALLIYALACFLLFCFCCHRVGRRQGVYSSWVRFSVFCLSLVILLTPVYMKFLFHGVGYRDTCELGNVLLWFMTWPLFLWVALAQSICFGSVSVPAMAEKAARSSRSRIARLYYLFFGPGPEAGFRTVLSLWVFSSMLFLLTFSLHDYHGLEQTVCVAPYFAAMPGTLLFLLPGLRRRRWAFYLCIAAFWGLFLVMGSASGPLSDLERFWERPDWNHSEVIVRWGIMGLPFMGSYGSRLQDWAAPFAGLAAGALGMLGLSLTLYFRTRANNKESA